MASLRQMMQQQQQQQQQRGGLSANSSLDHSGYMSDRNELGFHHHQQQQQQQRVLMNGGYIPNRNMRYGTTENRGFYFSFSDQ